MESRMPTLRKRKILAEAQGAGTQSNSNSASNQWLYKDVTVKENKAIGEMGIDKGMLKKRLGLLGRLGTSSDWVKYELF
jgi:hypothetical protein